MARCSILRSVFSGLIILYYFQQCNNELLKVGEKKPEADNQYEPEKDSSTVFSLYDANGEWGILSEDNVARPQENIQEDDFHFDGSLSTVDLVTVISSEIDIQEDQMQGVSQAKAATDYEDITVNLNDKRTKRSANARNLSPVGIRQTRTSGQAPWQINQGICPPILCGGPASIQEAPGNIQSKPGEIDVIVPVEVDNLQSKPTSGKTFSFFEGDIVLDRDMRQRISRQRRNLPHQRWRRAVVRPVSRLWRYGIVPYVIHQNIGTKVRRLIEEAIRHYEDNTCLKFVPRTNQRDYIVYVSQPGCWSSVGKIGGEQFISLGYGCDYVGTVIHETGHALGFWHEQSRSDRDKYVKVIKKNISPRGRDQFAKRTVDEHSSRGYAYDYESIMHYGDRYFSKNNKPTLKLKGPGRRLHFKIGDKEHLSHIDVAQIRDIYYCNKKDSEEKACFPGWAKFKRSCYKYVNERATFDTAKATCLRMGARLIHIESSPEDDFIKDYTIKHKKSEGTWRTGGRKVNHKWWWYGKNGSTGHPPFNYTVWAPGHPWYYDSLVLVKYNGSPQNYVWRGSYATSTYPFICERKANVTTITSRTKGRNYRGYLDYTSKGITCQHWTAQYPHRHKTITGNRNIDVLQNGLGDHNFCRNPSAKRDKPWCFTTLNATKWQYCDVHIIKP